MKRAKDAEIILSDKDYQLQLLVDEVQKMMEKENEEKRKLDAMKKNKGQ